MDKTTTTPEIVVVSKTVTYNYHEAAKALAEVLPAGEEPEYQDVMTLIESWALSDFVYRDEPISPDELNYVDEQGRDLYWESLNYLEGGSDE